MLHYVIYTWCELYRPLVYWNAVTLCSKSTVKVNKLRGGETGFVRCRGRHLPVRVCSFSFLFSLTLMVKPANFLCNTHNAVFCHAVQSSQIWINNFDFISQLQESLASGSGSVFSESPWASFALEYKMYSAFVLFKYAVNLWCSVASVVNE